MKFSLKNDDGAVLYLDLKEREILYKALEHYAAMGKPEDYVIDNMPLICELEDVLYLPGFNKVSTYGSAFPEKMTCCEYCNISGLFRFFIIFIYFYKVSPFSFNFTCLFVNWNTFDIWNNGFIRFI